MDWPSTTPTSTRSPESPGVGTPPPRWATQTPPSDNAATATAVTTTETRSPAGPRIVSARMRSAGPTGLFPPTSARFLKHVQRVPQIVRVIADEADLIVRSGMEEPQFSGVQPLPVEVQARREGRIGTVRDVAGTG